MIFNIVGRNQDDHAKNFAFVMDKNGTWDVSPAYDITYANGAGYTKNHQLSLNGKVNNFTKKDIFGLAKNHSIKENTAKEYLEQISEVFSTFAKRAEELEIDNDFINIIEKSLRLKLQ